MRSLLLATTAAALVFASTAGLQAGKIESYQPVTDARLKNPEASNWLTWRGNYEGCLLYTSDAADE